MSSLYQKIKPIGGERMTDDDSCEDGVDYQIVGAGVVCDEDGNYRLEDCD